MPDLSQIAREFPGFPLESIPEGIPNWMTPIPRGDSDAMPMWADETYLESGGETGMALSIDFPDPARREMGPEWGRFCVFTLKDGEHVGPIVSTDEWPVALSELRRRFMAD